LIVRKRKDFEVKTRFSSSKSFPSLAPFIQINDFKIETIPSTTKVQQAIFRFTFSHRVSESELDKIMLMEMAETESKMLLAFLSLVGKSKIHFKGATVNGVPTDAHRLKYVYPQEPSINIAALQYYYEKLSRLPTRDLERLVNALRTFESAISLMKTNPTISFFLLVATVECLSNFQIERGSSKEKFVQFVTKYLHPELSDEKDELKKFQERLRTAYEIRNWFVHRGENIPKTVFLADKLQRKSVVFHRKKKELRAPGLVWLEKIIGGCLLGFLDTERPQRVHKFKKPVFRALAKKEGILRLKKKKGIPIKKGQPITADMLELD